MFRPNKLATIELLISLKKTELYKKQNPDSWFALYKAELSLAQEIFAYLHFLEIFLRNKITAEFNADFGDWLLTTNRNFHLNTKEQEKIDQILITLTKSKKATSSDNIVSNLSLGFWTNLFHRHYTSVWQQNKMIERVFPFLKSRERSLKQVQKELEEIRKFRNRIFHFESLQNSNAPQMQMLIDKFIYGISGLRIEELLDD